MRDNERVRSISIPYESLVRKADPDRSKEIVKETEYEFNGGLRIFTANRAQRFPYPVPLPNSPDGGDLDFSVDGNISSTVV